MLRRDDRRPQDRPATHVHAATGRPRFFTDQQQSRRLMNEHEGNIMTKTNASRTFSRTAMLRALLLGASSITMVTAAAVPAAAQTTTTQISGQVTDAAGAPVAGAVVTATDVATGQTVSATSDATGNYTLAGLRPSDYTIRTTI